MLKNLSEKIKRVFSLRPGESNLVLILGVILLCNSIAVQISGIVSISNFLSAGGVNNFLIVWFIDDIVILLMAGLQTLIVDRFNRNALMKGLTFGFGMVFLVLRLMFTFGMPDWLNYGLLYLLSEQQELFIPLIFWIMANDMLDVSQTKRLFPLIATLNFIGKLIGIGIAAFSPAWFARIHVRQEEVLLINILLYLIS